MNAPFIKTAPTIHQPPPLSPPSTYSRKLFNNILAHALHPNVHRATFCCYSAMTPCTCCQKKLKHVELLFAHLSCLHCSVSLLTDLLMILSMQWGNMLTGTNRLCILTGFNVMVTQGYRWHANTSPSRFCYLWTWLLLMSAQRLMESFNHTHTEAHTERAEHTRLMYLPYLKFNQM